MRRLLLSLTVACFVLTLVSCSKEDEPPTKVEPIKNHLDKAKAVAAAASKAAARTDRLSAVADGLRTKRTPKTTILDLWRQRPSFSRDACGAGLPDRRCDQGGWHCLTPA